MNQLSKGFAKGLFVIGLLLIGFGVLVYVLKEVLAVIAAAIFVFVGGLCCFNAVRVFLAARSQGSQTADHQHRQNVHVRIDSEEEF